MEERNVDDERHPASMSVLVVLTSATSVNHIDFPAGTSANGFIQIYTTLTAANFHVVLVTPNGAPPEFYCEDDKGEAWMREHKQLYSRPQRIEDVTETNFDAIFLPSALGAIQDLADHEILGALVQAFLTRKKPIGAVGYGVAGLCTAMAAESEWCFSEFNLTSVSVYECSNTPYFDKLPFIIEDFIKDNGGKYNCNESENSIHVIVDRNLVTGQNTQSTGLVVQNVVWLMKN